MGRHFDFDEGVARELGGGEVASDPGSTNSKPEHTRTSRSSRWLTRSYGSVGRCWHVGKSIGRPYRLPPAVWPGAIDSNLKA